MSLKMRWWLFWCKHNRRYGICYSRECGGCICCLMSWNDFDLFRKNELYCRNDRKLKLLSHHFLFNHIYVFRIIEIIVISVFTVNWLDDARCLSCDCMVIIWRYDCDPFFTEDRCHGQRTCHSSGELSSLGEPCPALGSYLSIEYHCKHG